MPRRPIERDNPLTPESVGPLSRPLSVAQLPPDGLEVTVTATADERAALARDFDLPAIHALEGRFRVTGSARQARVAGRVTAAITRTCVVTLEPFDSVLEEAVTVAFAAPDADAGGFAAGGAGSAAEPPDEIVDGRIDLGALTAEFLVLGLDPYPRKPGAASPSRRDGRRLRPPDAAASRRRSRIDSAADRVHIRGKCRYSSAATGRRPAQDLAAHVRTSAHLARRDGRRSRAFGRRPRRGARARAPSRHPLPDVRRRGAIAPLLERASRGCGRGRDPPHRRRRPHGRQAEPGAARGPREIVDVAGASQAVQDGEADAAVSAGNTGALMAMAKFCLQDDGRISSARRSPAIWPTLRGESIVLDVGATIGADAEHLVDFAIMGAAMARIVFDLDRPTVGLLNVGTEEIKGIEEVKEAGAASCARRDLPHLAYHGFVEGDDLGKGTVDVVVTEGFTGNIALKTAEGTAQADRRYLRAAMSRTLMAKIGYLFARQAFDALREKMDPRKVNGGVFLGLEGIVIKSHGGTDALGFASAIDIAYDMAHYELHADDPRSMLEPDVPAVSARRPCGRKSRMCDAVSGPSSAASAPLCPSACVTNRRARQRWSTPPTNGSSSAPASAQRHIAGRRRDHLGARRSGRPRRRSRDAGLRARRHRPRSSAPPRRRTTPFPSTATQIQAGLGIHPRRRLRPAGGLHRLRLRGRDRRQVPDVRLAQARAGDRRRDLLAHPRLERPHHLRAVRRRRRRHRARGAGGRGHRRSDRGVLTSHLRSDGRHREKLYVDGGPGSTTHHRRTCAWRARRSSASPSAWSPT